MVETTSFSFSFECLWDEKKFHRFMQDYVHYCWIFSVLYIVAIFGGKRLMENRERFALRSPMILWSGTLAVFSILGTIRTWMGMVDLFRHDGFYGTVCTNPDARSYCNIGFWGGLFTLSKVYELGDTLFIVLRKQPLIFLHWYHHITVLIYNWYSYAEHAAPGKSFYTINYTVHAFMYSYYTMTALKYRPPTWMKKFITALQLSQMGVGCSLNAYSYYLKSNGVFCEQSYDNLLYSTLMYFSYLLLFAKFYRDAYMRPKTAAIKKDDLGVCSNGVYNGATTFSNGHSKVNGREPTIANGKESTVANGNRIQRRPLNNHVNGAANGNSRDLKAKMQ